MNYSKLTSSPHVKCTSCNEKFKVTCLKNSNRRSFSKLIAISPLLLIVKPSKSYAIAPAVIWAYAGLITSIATLITSINDWRETSHEIEQDKYLRIAKLEDGNTLYVNLNECIDCGICHMYFYKDAPEDEVEDMIKQCPVEAFYIKEK